MLNEEVLWNFLIVSGYLKIEEPILTKNGDTLCKVKIPNQELLNLFSNIISGWFRTDEVSSNMIKDMMSYLVNGKMKKFEEDFKYIIRKTFSYFDVGKNVAENFYHAFTLGLLVNLDGKYRVISNKESGGGSPDVIIIPNDNTKKGVIIEFKVSENNDEESMSQAVEKALKQIDDKKYSDEFLHLGIKKIIKIGIAFCGKIVKLDYKETIL